MYCINWSNVGIGTDSPAAPLHVVGKVMAGNVLTTHGHANADDLILGDISNAATGMTIVSTGSGNIHFGDGTSSGNANIQGQLVYAHNDNSMRFYTAVAEKFRITSVGAFGFNTSSPGNTLVVKAQSGSDRGIELAHANGYKVAELVHHGSGSEGRLSLYDTGTETVRLHGESGQHTFINSGNVGIGTSSPEGRLHVEVLGSNATPPIKINRGLDGGRIQLQYSSNETGYGEIGQMYAGTGRTQIWIGANLNSFSTGHNSSPAQHDANYASWFSDWDSYRDRFTIGRIASGTTSRVMVINSSGNVGIGTDSPGHSLDILNAGSGDATIKVKSTTGGDPTLLFDSAAANRSAVIRFMDQGSFVAGRIQYVHNGDRMDFQAGSSTGATMSVKNGMVGIAQTSFGANGKLQVTGGIGLTGNSEVRQSTNADGSTLKFFGTQFVAGTNNSHSYAYSGGGLIASVSPSAGAIMLDAGANSTSGHRLKVINGGNGIDGSLQYLSGTTSVFHIDSSSGKVGIGVNPPAGVLDVRFANRNGLYVGSTTGSGSFLLLDGAGNGDGAGGDYAYLEHNSNGHLVFNVGNSGNGVGERMRIEAGGNIGINENNPDGLLHIKKGTFGGTYTPDSADQLILENSDSAMIDIRTPNSNSGGVLFSDSDGRGRGILLYAHSNDTLYTYTASGVRAALNHNGLNIGSSTLPTSTLVVGVKNSDAAFQLNGGSNGNASFVEKVDSKPGSYSTITVEAQLPGAGGYFYEIQTGSASTAASQAGGGYTNGTSNFSHHLSYGSNWTVTSPSNDKVRFVTSQVGTHPVVRIKIGCGLTAGLDQSDVTITYS